MKEKTYLAKTNLPQTLVQGVIDQFGDWDSFLESYEDVVKHGINGGFPGFIYYDDTVPFAENYREEIVKMLVEDAEEMGCDVVEMICNFGVFRNEKPDKETKRDIYNYITGFPCEGTYIPNLMAWYAAEKVCYEFYDKLNNYMDMKLKEFLNQNSAAIDAIVSDYVSEMEWDEGMNSHPSDYFTDTYDVAIELCEDAELGRELQRYIEGEVIERLRI